MRCWLAANVTASAISFVLGLQSDLSSFRLAILCLKDSLSALSCAVGSLYLMRVGI